MPVQATFKFYSEDVEGTTYIVELRIFGPSTHNITAEILWGTEEPTQIKRIEAISLDEIWSKLNAFSLEPNRSLQGLYLQCLETFGEQLEAEAYNDFYSS
jgi:hypothetical protein